MSLRWRIALALGAIAATTTIVVGVIGYRTTRDRLYDEIDRSLTDSIALLDRRARSAGASSTGCPNAARSSVYDIQVLGPDGEVYRQHLRGRIRSSTRRRSRSSGDRG